MHLFSKTTCLEIKFILMFFTLRATRDSLNSYTPLSAYVRVDLSLVVSERICAVNAALAVSFLFVFTFTFSLVTFTVLCTVCALLA